MAQTLQQIQKIWAQLGLNQRVTIILAFVGILAAVILTGVWASRPNMQLLYGNLDAADMSQVVAYVEGQAIPYRLGAGGTSIYVPSQHVDRLRMSTNTEGLITGGAIGYELFDKGQFGVSDFVQRLNKQRALQGELQRAIMTIKGVRRARVLVNQPDNRLLLDQNRSEPTAIVTVDTGGSILSDRAVNGIRNIVARAVEGLKVDNVAVVDNNGNTLSEKLAGNDDIGVASSHLEHRKSLEKYFTGKVEDLLVRVVGPDNVKAQVSVELDTESRTVVSESFDPESSVARTERKREEKRNSTERKVGPPIVGVEPNVPGGVGTDTGETVASENEGIKETQVTNEISKISSETIHRPGSIRKIAAAVFVAQRGTMGEGGQFTPQPRSDQEINQIRVMVANAIGVSLTDAPSLVSIVEAPFVKEEAPAHHPVYGIIGKVLEWLDLNGPMVAAALAVMIVLAFFVMLRRYRPVALPVETPAVTADGLGRARNVTPSNLTPELLNDLIQQKPENVSTALRNWIQSSTTK